MSTQRYSVTPHPIDTLLAWVKSGEIAIPEIQRPFVWEPTKVRNLLDSLYQGYPVGYLIAWRNPTVKLKDGTSSAGKRVLIDGQQRVTALMAGLLGREVLTKDYETTRIRIAFHPQTEKFEVSNPAIRKDVAWIEDVATVFAPEADLIELTEDYVAKNPNADRKQVGKVLQKLGKIVNNPVGLIELAEDLDIETVTEIFIRVNSAGAELSQADFAMSKIAANESYGGNLLRKAIDYFCHLAVAPDFLSRIEKGDKVFADSEFFQQMRWLKDVNDDIYDPTYTDMLRVAFTAEFGRGKLADLVALLSGRNFETRHLPPITHPHAHRTTLLHTNEALSILHLGLPLEQHPYLQKGLLAQQPFQLPNLALPSAHFGLLPRSGPRRSGKLRSWADYGGKSLPAVSAIVFLLNKAAA